MAQSSPGGGVDDSNGVFQLEGNATKDAAICFDLTGGADGGPLVMAVALGTSCGAGFTYVPFGAQAEDWSTIFAANNGGATAAVAFSFASDLFNNRNDNQYTGGSTKDNLDISGWLWKNGSPQGKDDIEHAYAAAYTASNGHTILLAGVDRWDNSGDSTMGFWFVKNSTIGSGVTPTCGVGSGCSFGGSHSDGDLLIVSDFSQGGPVANIAVYLWKTNPSGIPNCTNNLCQVTTIPGALIGECNPLTGNKDLCGIVPDQNVPAPWTFVDKHLGTTPNFEKGEFLEVGLDLSTIFQTTPCFSTFFAETRASNSPTSTLSDFTKPVPFRLCSISATKQCDGATINGDGTTVTYNFSGHITAQGGSFTNVSISDNPNSCGYKSSSVPGTVCTDASGHTISNLVLTQPNPNTASPGTPANYSGSFVANFTSSTFDNLAQASGTAPDGSTLTGPANGASWLVGGSVPQVCSPVSSGCLQLDKSCTTSVTSGSPLTLDVNFSGTITNNANVQVSSITIVDSPAAAGAISITCGSGCTGSGNGSFTLAPGGTASYSGKYTESGSGIVCTPDASGRCKFTDTVTASGTGALGAGVIHSCKPDITATCSLCPNNTCSGGN
jgi:hypothetical protein